MNTFMKELEEQYNYKFTENSALAHRSTGSKVYDLFAFGGAYSCLKMHLMKILILH